MDTTNVLAKFEVRSFTRSRDCGSVVVKDLRLKDEDKDKDLMSKEEDKDKESSFKDKDKDLGQH